MTDGGHPTDEDDCRSTCSARSPSMPPFAYSAGWPIISPPATPAAASSSFASIRRSLRSAVTAARLTFASAPRSWPCPGWPLRWVSRGGGIVLHLPGQLAVYPVLPLAGLGLDVPGYLGRLHQALVALLDEFGIHGETHPDQAGVWVGSRLLAAVGVAVRQQVTTFGAWLNVDPDLTLPRMVLSGGRDGGQMTSLARERRGPPRPALVRQRLVEHVRDGFGFEQADVLFQPPTELGHVRLAARS